LSEKELMQAHICAQLGMKCGRKCCALSHYYWLVVVSPEHLNIRTKCLYPWCTNKHTMKLTNCSVDVGLETVNLTTICIAPNRNIDGAETGLIGAPVENRCAQKNHSGARSEYRQSPVQKTIEWLPQPSGHQELRHCARLTAGQHDGIQTLEIVWLANFDYFYAEIAKNLSVSEKCSLNREYSDSHVHLGASQS